MKENLEKTRGLVFSQRVMLALVEKGLLREEAYRIVQRDSKQVLENKKDFIEVLKDDAEAMSYLSQAELEKLFDYSYYLRNLGVVFERLEKVKV